MQRLVSVGGRNIGLLRGGPFHLLLTEIYGVSLSDATERIGSK